MTNRISDPSAISVTGHLVDLRLVQPSDAEFIYDLRSSKPLAQHLTPITGTVVDQENWIKAYKDREKAGLEYYFLIQTKQGRPCGLVRLYDVTTSSFTWGSILLHPNRPRKAALEATLMSLTFGFETLGCDLAVLDVRRANTHATAFYKRFGMRHVRSDDIDHYFEITRADLDAIRDTHLAAICAE